MRRSYHSPLLPAILPQLLQQVIRPRPTSWWRRLAWGWGTTCWGEVSPATGTFWARLQRGGRSSTIQLRGSWGANPMAPGSMVQLTLGLSAGAKLGLTLTLAAWVLAGLAGGLLTDPQRWPLIFLLTPVVFFIGFAYLEIYQAERYLRRALDLIPLAS